VKPSLDVHSNYISTRFGSTHDAGDIGELYEKYAPFVKYNFIRHLPEGKKLRILEIGCGFGQMLHALKLYGYNNISGVDLSPECVDFCRNNGFEVTQGDLVTFFGTEREPYDVIIMNDIIEHIAKADIIPSLKSCHGALSPAGLLMMKTFNSTNPILGLDARYCDFTHKLGFTESSFRQVLLVAGFSPQNVRILPSHLYVYFYNPLNYVAWLMNSFINLCIKFYFKLNGRVIANIFTKNMIAIAKR
jgi:2-polyprenyl-3-methyl-5-hydroxy-6-metoxy-1,4-benzoquinol methylase